MKVALMSLMMLFSSQVLAKTEFSKVVDYVQKTYADKFTDYPILIFDMDEVEARFAGAKAFGEGKEKEKQRAAIVQKYVKEETGVELTPAEAIGYETYTSALKSGAYALPTLMDGPNRRKVYKMCAVFPSSANSNKRLEMERMTGLKTPGAYEHTTYTGLQKKLEFKELQLFSLYHELGHCMDRVFMPENYNTYEVDPHDVHLSESYAEVFALMILEKEGIKGTGETRALMRNLYTQKMGKWFIDNPQNGFGNPMYLKGGIIYYLAPVLLAADEFLARKRDFVKQDMEVLLLKAKEFVDGNALNSRSFHGVFRAMSEDKDKVLSFYRDYAQSTPGFFADAYSDILTFLDFSPYLLGQMLGSEADDNSGAPITTIGTEELCSLTNKKQLMDAVELKRVELSDESREYGGQLAVQKQLNNIYEEWSKCL
jgi:hypothetical protein